MCVTCECDRSFQAHSNTPYTHTHNHAHKVKQNHHPSMIPYSIQPLFKARPPHLFPFYIWQTINATLPYQAGRFNIFICRIYTHRKTPTHSYKLSHTNIQLLATPLENCYVTGCITNALVMSKWCYYCLHHHQATQQ